VIRLLTPEVPPATDWLSYLDESYETGIFSNFGPNARALAREMADGVEGGRHACMTSSATTGLSAVLLALGIRGKVGVPSFTFPATASAVFQAGATPEGLEVDPDTWELDIAALDARLAQGGIAAVIHVRSFGYCRSLDAVEQVCARHDVPMIVDAAAAYGGVEPDGRPVGLRGVAEVMSLHATKPLAAGEGGVVLAQPELIGEVEKAINFSLAGGAAADRWGLNAKMSEFSAAVGRAALVRLPQVMAARQAQAALWATLLSDIDGVVLPRGHGTPPWQLYAFRLPGRDAQAVQQALARAGAQSRVYYSPTVASRWRDAAACPVADALSHDMLSLPMGRHLTSDDQHRVAGWLADILADVPVCESTAP
jgi:dTDP-4-amino-4,6-dideoxygalactose transaminase